MHKTHSQDFPRLSESDTPGSCSRSRASRCPAVTYFLCSRLYHESYFWEDFIFWIHCPWGFLFMLVLDASPLLIPDAILLLTTPPNQRDEIWPGVRARALREAAASAARTGLLSAAVVTSRKRSRDPAEPPSRLWARAAKRKPRQIFAAVAAVAVAAAVTGGAAAQVARIAARHAPSAVASDDEADYGRQSRPHWGFGSKSDGDMLAPSPAPTRSSSRPRRLRRGRSTSSETSSRTASVGDSAGVAASAAEALADTAESCGRPASFGDCAPPLRDPFSAGFSFLAPSQQPGRVSEEDAFDGSRKSAQAGALSDGRTGTSWTLRRRRPPTWAASAGPST